MFVNLQYNFIEMDTAIQCFLFPVYFHLIEKPKLKTDYLDINLVLHVVNQGILPQIDFSRGPEHFSIIISLIFHIFSSPEPKAHKVSL